MDKTFDSENLMDGYSVKTEVCSREAAKFDGYGPRACSAEVINPRTLTECSKYPRRPCGRNGFLVAKIPVVLSEFIVQIDVETDIRLEECALDIKRIKKHVFLTQCKLIPNTDKLFLSGYFRKNIEYSTVRYADRKGVNGDIKHTTVKVPFECVTKVPFCIRPQFSERFPQTEVELLGKDELGKVPFEQDFRDFIPFNEKVKCELVWAKINEEIIEGEQFDVRDNSTEHTFRTFTEKTVAYLKLKLFQVQQVNIYGPYHYDDLPANDKPMEEIQPDEDIEE